ncbi:hypothetical protein [Sphingomonas sp. BAUL-RG-20F-R05-02]|uniref:hypothetical protein n=1 Tax=Sphingomonas sp. BAUL-RG-20F-R05-02 TaxID=2914830 RepID=UPI001F59788F|nr:hypothetical protein [Sphingomonas sp. BAUL-RG-20F-R05-02]
MTLYAARPGHDLGFGNLDQTLNVWRPTGVAGKVLPVPIFYAGGWVAGLLDAYGASVCGFSRNSA